MKEAPSHFSIIPGRTFQHPEPLQVQPSAPILPVFIPNQGCPRRCVFCDQSAQTGVPAQGGGALEQLIHTLEADLQQRKDTDATPFELAFYGGTFTALAEEVFARFLHLAERFRSAGVLCAARCSTRPDAINPSILARLRDAGFTMVELGVQSYAPLALHKSGRGYTPVCAMEACGMVKEGGLALGVQLLPGLPGQTARDFREDVRRAAGLRPELVRLYPCLVLAGAPLAGAWRSGSYVPWGVERTVNSLAGALLSFWNAGIKVGRIGVAQEQGLAAQVLAGPWHPGLGGMVRAAALHRLVRREVQRLDKVGAHPVQGMAAPRRYQGEFWGHKGALAPCYARVGLTRKNVTFWNKGYFALY